MAVAPAVPEAFVIEGGNALSGRIRTAGNKNGALPILAATLLADEPVTLSNVPRIRDVETMIELLNGLGADAEWIGANDVHVDASGLSSYEVDPALASRIRASFLLAGPLLARVGRASVPPPGGDVRPGRGRARAARRAGQQRRDPRHRLLRRAGAGAARAPDGGEPGRRDDRDAARARALRAPPRRPHRQHRFGRELGVAAGRGRLRGHE